MNCLPESGRVVHRIGKTLVIAALIATVGAHWVLLQSVAWTTMLASNLRSDDLASAIGKTFDGQHPCRLCKQIAEGKKAERKSASAPVPSKFECVSGLERIVIRPPRVFSLAALLSFNSGRLAHQPPVPPPRFTA